MAKVKYHIPDKELPKVNKEKGWIEKYEFEIKPYFELLDSKVDKNFIIEISSFREFSFFRYLIDYEVKKRKNEFIITLRGLSTDNDFFPGSGKATSRIEFGALAGTYNFHFRRMSGEENLIQYKIDPIQNKITLVRLLPDKKSNRIFIKTLE